MKKILDVLTLISLGSAGEPQEYKDFERERQYYRWELAVIYTSLILTSILLTTLYCSHP